MNSGNEKRIRELLFDGEHARLNWTRYSVLLVIAAIIATVGLQRNSGATVIAAMLIAPMMTPILGIAAVIVMGLRKRLVYLLVAVALSAIGILCLSFAILFIAEVPRGLHITPEVLARTDPGLEELMVALAAGIAGAYIHMRRQEVSLLPGVAIGVSLVPPLAAAGMLFYFQEAAKAGDAILLFLANLSAIVFSACAVFFIFGIRPVERNKSTVTRVGFGTAGTIAIMIIIAIHLASVTVARFRKASDEERVVSAVIAWSRNHAVEIARADVKLRAKGKTVELWLVYDVPLKFASVVTAPSKMVAKQLDFAALIKELSKVLGPNTDFIFRAQTRYAARLDLVSGKEKPLTFP